ncbi:hypothetical protein WJX72_005620 [[Myrmecia] bisecta]|uniref:Expansin-like EG45 domain-containing protein n=1 Tax=[Myrmecia] bisecta TaxID=41462 RepID=A0AAW1QQS5_9CHLO
MVACTFTAADTNSSGWIAGRATFYGHDGYDINKGSCGFGKLDPNTGTGLRVGAISDKDPDFTGACGRCYEAKCNPMDFTDANGKVLTGMGVCYDTNSTIVFRVTDTCPCNFPSNALSNKRWCCGDMRHFDLYEDAFAEIARPGAGAMALRFRAVACPTGPAKPIAPPSANTPLILPPGIFVTDYQNGFYDASYKADVSAAELETGTRQLYNSRCMPKV